MQFLIQKATSDDHIYIAEPGMGPLPGMMLMQGLPPGYMDMGMMPPGRIPPFYPCQVVASSISYRHLLSFSSV